MLKPLKKVMEMLKAHLEIWSKSGWNVEVVEISDPTAEVLIDHT